MGIAPISYVSEGLKTVEFYTGDSEGNILYCDTRTGGPTGWTLDTLFRLRNVDASPGGAIALTKGMALGDRSGTRWLFSGTADLMVTDFSEDRMLRNDEQYIFALNLDKITDTAGVETTTDLTALNYMRNTSSALPAWVGEVSSPQVAVPADAFGWRLKLRPKMVGDTPTDAEYVTTTPLLYGGVLYVSTFIPRTRHSDDQEQCRDIGEGRLYALDPVTGASKWDDGTQQSYAFDNVKIVGISAARGNLFLGIKALRPGSVEAFGQYEELRHFRGHALNTIIEIASASLPEGKPDLTPIVPHLQYWREVF
jgi:Tfp pilus tip-associated adhesin PilY1